MKEIWLKNAALFGMSGCLLGVICHMTVVDVDLWHGMAVFREALATGWIPQNDVFSYISTISPAVHHEWGMGAIIYFLTVSLGLGSAGLMALKYTLSAAVAIGSFVCARKRGASYSVFTWLAPLGILMGSIGFTTVRAQLFTLIFLLVLLFLLEEDRLGRRYWIAVWLPLHVIWLNLHAGFVVGVGLVIFYTLERFVMEFIERKTLHEAFLKVSHLMIVCSLLVMLVIINPYGWNYFSYLWRAILLDRSQLILEWRPIWQISDPGLVLFLFFTSLGLIVYSAAQRGVLNMPHMLFLILTFWLALWHIRFLSIYTLLWMVCVPAYIEETKAGPILKKLWRTKKNFLFAIWIILGCLGTYKAIHNQFWELRIPTTLNKRKEKAPIYPSGVVEYLSEQKFNGNLMVPFTLGAYITWKLYPAVKVSMDSRYEVAYTQDAVEENLKFYSAEGAWQKTLIKYPTDAILVPRSSPLDHLIEQLTHPLVEEKPPKWRRVYLDDFFSLFMRVESVNQFYFVDKRGVTVSGKFP